MPALKIITAKGSALSGKTDGPGVDLLRHEQLREVWDRLIAAETRTYYFGDLAGFYSHQRQIVTFLSFFVSSSAVASVLAKRPSWIPVVLSLIVALANAYSLVFNLDLKMRIMAELNQSWSEVAFGYERIWQNPYTEESESLYRQLDDTERDLSMIAAAAAPNNQKKMAKWQDRVLELRNLKEASHVER